MNPQAFLSWCSLLAAAAAGACIPYTVATTAQPVPEGEVAPTLVWYSIPGGIESYRDSASSSSLPFSAFDIESRMGVSDRADVGVRVPALSGLVVTYKYRLTETFDPTAPALAIMAGGGLVNLGNHAHFELTLIGSGRQSLFTPYGGLRVGQVVPLSRDAVSDSPTAGPFMGLRIGREELGVSAEVGVFYDRSALGLRSGNVIFVPALVLHGSELIRMVSGAMGTRRR